LTISGFIPVFSVSFLDEDRIAFADFRKSVQLENLALPLPVLTTLVTAFFRTVKPIFTTVKAIFRTVKPTFKTVKKPFKIYHCSG
jgi:hypothetical protein